MITRERLGYAPGGMTDALFLIQDLDQLNAAIEHGGSEPDTLLEASAECLIEAKRLGIPDVVVQTLIQRARILLAGRRYAEAIAVLSEAEQELGDLRAHDLKVRIHARLAEAYAGCSNWQAVSDVCEAGIRIVEAHRYDVSGQYLQSAYLRSRIDLYSRGALAAYETGRLRVMLERAELSKCRSVLRQNIGSTPSLAAADAARAFCAVCEQIDRAGVKGLGDEKLAALLSKRRTLWDLLLIEQGQHSRQSELPEFDLSAIQTLLVPDEAVLYYYWIDYTKLLVALIDSRRFIAKLQSIDAEQRTDLDRFCQGIMERLSPDMPGFKTYFDRLTEFLPILLPAEIAGQLEDAQRLLISPHQVLHAVPFHALPWNQEHRYLIERFAVTYVPNLRSLQMRFQPPATPSMFGLGICDYRVPGHCLNSLPEAVEEISELSELWENNGLENLCVTGQQASRDQLKSLARSGRLREFTGLHIATHGQNVNSDTPMESFLYLYDSIVDGLEIASWELKAELVVLSACSSGQRAISGRGMPDLPGDDLFGLQAAFFAAGAKRVIGSLWPVHSPAAKAIMTALHRQLARGQSPETALRSAILEYLRTARVGNRQSFYWAPFFLSAVGRPVVPSSVLM